MIDCTPEKNNRIVVLMVLRQKTEVVAPPDIRDTAQMPYVEPEKVAILEENKRLEEFWERNRDALYNDPNYRNKVLVIAMNSSGQVAEIVECADKISDLIDLLNGRYRDVLTLTIRVLSRNLRILSEQELAAEREKQ